MNQSDLSLVTLRPEHKAQFLLMIEEYQAAGEHRYQSTIAQARKDFSVYLQWLEDLRSGKGLREGFVPESIFWLVQGNDYFVGSSRLRHELTPALAREGGHIGYDIRPSERRKGYGTRLLSLTLEKAKQMGLERVLLTCDTDNTASARIIEKNGGVMSSQLVSEKSGKLISRYWIAL